MKKMIEKAVIIFLVAASINCFAQTDSKELLNQVAKDDTTAIGAIAMYPPDVRKDIFTASKYPEILVRLISMQKNSKADFDKLISPYTKEEQENIWNLTRYPALIAELAKDKKKSETEINNILINYPEEIHKAALSEGIKNYDLLVQIDQKNKIYKMGFELLVKEYPKEAADAYRNMINQPEVLNILSDNMQFTVLIGDIYKKEPELVLNKVDSLNLVIAKKNARDIADWKQSVENNPKAKEEYVEAAKQYAQENGYQSDECCTALQPDITSYNVYPFNWWFGYPYWYPYAYWNPYPFWYDWGFYFGHGRDLFFFGLPSVYFMDWFFYYPEHFYRYPELSNHYYNYYNHHSDSRNFNSISKGVYEWRERNKDIVNNEWDKVTDDGRIQHFREYGKMETKRAKYNERNPQNQLGRSEYLQGRQNKYRDIKTESFTKQPGKNEQYSRPVQQDIQVPERKPPVATPERYKAYENNQRNNVRENQKQFQQNQQQQSKPEQRPQLRQPEQSQQQNQQPQHNYNQMREAQQYHQNTWHQIQPNQPAPHSMPSGKNYHGASSLGGKRR